MHASTIFNFESLAQIFAHPELAVFHPWISSQFVGRTRKISFSKKKYASRSNPFDAKIVLGEKSDSPSDKRQQKFGKEMGSKWVNVLHTMSGKSLSENDSLDLMNVKSSFTSIEEYSSNEWDIKLLRQGPEGLSNVISCLLYLFCSSYSHLLLVLDDREFYDKQVPFTLEKQRKIAASLNTLVYNSLSWSVSPQYRPLVESAVRCLHLLYERDCRHQFCPPDLLLSPGKNNRLPVAVAARIYEVFSSAEGRPFSSMGPVITTIPHVFPFEERI